MEFQTGYKVESVLDSLNKGLHAAMRQENVVLIGEDVLDPYGGAFKVVKGLSTAYPEKVFSSPISEAGIIGIAGGMAIKGLRPVVEIMFGDFIMLGADQIINHLSKFNYMYANQVSCPVVIRTPMGGRRGYGPTHSQTLEKHLMGVPGLTIVSPVHIKSNVDPTTPGELLKKVILESTAPVMFIENKLQYHLPLVDTSSNKIFDISSLIIEPDTNTPFYQVQVKGAPKASLTIICYGYMAHLAMQAIELLAFNDEIFCEVVIPTKIAPLSISPILESIQKTEKLLTIEEGAGPFGWGAEVVASIVEKFDQPLKAVKRITAEDHPIPAARHLEEQSLPSISQIIKVVQTMV